MVTTLKNFDCPESPGWHAHFTRRNTTLKQIKNQKCSLRYKRARYYSPQLGRFISRDPLGFVDGMNLSRAYFAPGKVDPSGKGIATIAYGCESFRHWCWGECTCVYAGQTNAILKAAMHVVAFGCCVDSCIIADCGGLILQPTYMQACVQTKLRRLLTLANFPWLLSCTCD